MHIAFMFHAVAARFLAHSVLKEASCCRVAVNTSPICAVRPRGLRKGAVLPGDKGGFALKLTTDLPN